MGKSIGRLLTCCFGRDEEKDIETNYITPKPTTVEPDNESDIEYLTIAYSIRASIYGENGRFIEALSDIENSLKLNPSDVNTIYNKARLQIVQKKYKEGIITLEMVESIYKKQKLNIPVLISSIHYMKGICRYSLKEDNFCVDFNKALVFINFLDKNNIDFIKNVCE